MLPWVTTLYITHILQRHQGNVFFPKLTYHNTN
ncbi:hypothetical protein ['Chrysanthemum coronarium' phytoplasma]|nr:hypothetical protein ['Chrysanthemum coronarium' phytoplasma]